MNGGKEDKLLGVSYLLQDLPIFFPHLYPQTIMTALKYFYSFCNVFKERDIC